MPILFTRSNGIYRIEWRSLRAASQIAVRWELLPSTPFKGA